MPSFTTQVELHGATGEEYNRLDMAALRCADVTLEHSYRYFVLTNGADLSTIRGRIHCERKT
jgi:hypothetical protein